MVGPGTRALVSAAVVLVIKLSSSARLGLEGIHYPK